ncbi:FG-GAP-like repeat-containing protein [Lacinutrix sp. MEBiC02595]
MKLKLLLVVTTFFYCFTVCGQIGFEENNVILNYEAYSGFFTPIYSGDIDGDSDNDLIVGLKGASELAWLENLDGLGDFGRPKTIDFSNVYEDKHSSIYLVDIDDDGDKDILSGRLGSIVWYENLDGLGTFSISQTINFDAELIYFADIDGDMDVDIIASSGEIVGGDRIFAWFENTDGQGTFGAPNIINDEFDIYSFHLVDFDNDNDLDIVSGGYNYVRFYENIDGLGTFQFVGNIIDSVIKSISSIDYDNDGDMDVIAISDENGQMKWFENTDGMGSFSSGTEIGGGGSFVDVVDIDGNGYLDIITPGSLRKNNGSGNFSSSYFPINMNNPNHVQAIDLDSDGDLDILRGYRFDNNISWNENLDTQGNFGDEKIILAKVSDPNDVLSVDMDLDGDEDILFCSDNILGWFENTDGYGLFGNIKVIDYNSSTNSGSYNFVFAFDIDGDGDLDVVSATSSSVRWFENIDSQETSFVRHFIGSVPNNNIYGTSISVEDIDGDNDGDILINSHGNILWFENLDGQGDFSASEVLISNAYSGPIYLIDMDHDNDNDIVFGSSDIYWVENIDGQGTFGNPQLISTGIGEIDVVYVADIDNDNDMDIVSASSEDHEIVWYENLDGLGSFGTKQTIFTDESSLIKSIFSNDMDNDGDMDIVSTSYSSSGLTIGDIFWHENIDGQGTFTSSQLISTNPQRPVSVCSSDIDGDGDADVLMSSINDNRITWYKNLGVLGNEINGVIQLDLDLNGCDNNDINVSNLLINADNGNDSFSTFTLNNGSYQIAVNEGSFTTSISNLPSYYTSNPVSQTSNFIGIGNVDTIDFCLTSNQTVNDLKIVVYPSQDDLRPGFDTSYQIVYKNVGTTILSDNITFEFDNTKLNFLNASKPISSQTSNTLTFNFTDLNPFETRTIDLEFNVFAPPTTNIDDVLISTATINPVTGDETEEDNTFILNQTVIGSYDPNDIRVLEGEEILLEEADKYLHYIIRFQNTGTASAINVHVENVLDDKLDYTTMQIESLSHTGKVEITNGTMVDFIFNNINLADSTNDETNSHGFIAYKIKPKSDVVVGDVFYNTADIFFDFNPAITTNTVATEIVENLSVSEFNTNTFSVYPNPTENQLTITSKTPLSAITIFDINGRKIKDVKLSNHTLQYQLDVANLSNGMYFVELVSENSHETQKFIKK